MGIRVKMLLYLLYLLFSFLKGLVVEWGQWMVTWVAPKPYSRKLASWAVQRG